MGDFSSCLFPDFRACGEVMRLNIIWIVKLVQDKALAIRLHLRGKVTRTFHTLLLRHFNQFSTIGQHGILTFLTHVIWHDQLHFITTHGCNHG